MTPPNSQAPETTLAPSPTKKRQRYRLDPTRVRSYPLRHIQQGLEVLVALDQRALLTNGQIARLLFDNQPNSNGDLRSLFAAEKAASKQLQRLWESRFVDRKAVILTSKRTGHPYHHFVNVLTIEGAAVVERHYMDEGRGQALRWTRASSEVSNQTIEHALAINDLYVLAKRACDRVGGRLFAWRDDRQLSAMNRAKQTHFLSIPDAFFAIALNGVATGYFLEIDLGTESISGERSTRIWREKIDGYGRYLRDRYPDEEFFEGIPAPTVLTITTRAGRLLRMLDATQDTPGATSCWYTTAEAINPETSVSVTEDGPLRPVFDAETFWRPIWQVVGSAALHRLPRAPMRQTPR